MCVWPFITDNSNTNSQLDATITNFIDNYNQLNTFRAKYRPKHVELIVIINKICYCWF